MDGVTVQEFAAQLKKLPHKHKIVIAGNHELSFDPDEESARRQMYFGQTHNDELRKYGISNVRELLESCTYLEDAGIEVSSWDNGLLKRIDIIVNSLLINYLVTYHFLNILPLHRSAGTSQLVQCFSCTATSSTA